MRYPEFLKSGGTIGLVAPSFGVSGFPYEDRYYYAKKKFEDLGYKVVEAKHLYGIKHGKSASARIRAREFMEMYLNDEIDFIFSVAGGELMLEMIPYVKFDKLRKAKPKYFMGFSDNTCLTFTLNTLCDVAAIYGPCFGGFGMEPWDRSLNEALELITGKRRKFDSYEFYCGPSEEELLPEHVLDGYNLTEKVEYRTLDNKPAEMKGRLVGGCLDLLLNFCGTQFDKVKDFTDRYADDGIIWFMESCDLSVLDRYRGLWQLKNAGWFNNCKGIIFGRPERPDSMFSITEKEMLKNTLGDLKIPVIWGADFGHVQPSWSVLSGCVATVKAADGKGSIEFSLE